MFTALAGRLMTAEDLARALGLDAVKLEPLLYELVLADLLTVEDGRFANTTEAESTPKVARSLKVRTLPGCRRPGLRCRNAGRYRAARASSRPKRPLESDLAGTLPGFAEKRFSGNRENRDLSWIDRSPRRDGALRPASSPRRKSATGQIESTWHFRAVVAMPGLPGRTSSQFPKHPTDGLSAGSARIAASRDRQPKGVSRSGATEPASSPLRRFERRR